MADEVALRRRTPEERAAYIAGRVHDAEQAVIAAAKRYHEFASKPITDTSEYRLAAARDRPREIAMVEALSTAGQRVSYAVIALLVAETAAQMVAGIDSEEPQVSERLPAVEVLLDELLAEMRRHYEHATLANNILVDGRLNLRCQRCLRAPVPSAWVMRALCEPCLDQANRDGT